MDVITDNSKRGWIKVANSHEVPAYVNEYVALTKEAADTLEDQLFADPAKREYPIDSKPATWLAAAYFKEASDKGEYARKSVTENYIKERIKEAAEIYGISEDVDAVFKGTAVKVASAADNDENYCWIDGTGRRMYPVFDKEGAAKAISYFEENRFQYPLDMRIGIARNIIKKACDHNVEPSEVVMKEAGFGVPNRVKLMEEILERAKISNDPEVAIKFAKINESIANATTEELLENMDKLASVIDALDSANGLKAHYNVKIMSPQETIYSMTVKEASAAVEDSLVLSEHTFKITKLAELDPEVFNVLGDNFSDELSTDGKLDATKMAAILPTLPRPDKRLLEDEIKASFGRY